MAEKIVTIRARVAGTDEAVSTYERYTRKIEASTERLATLNKALTNAGAQNDEASSQKLFVRVKAQEAYIADLTKKRTQVVTNLQHAEAERHNAESTKARDSEMAGIAAQTKAGILARHAEVQAESKERVILHNEAEAANQKDAKAEAKRIQDVQTLHNNFTRQKIEGDRASVAASIRGMEEVEKIEKKKLAKAGGGKGKESLSGFGGKMILGHAAGQAMGDVIGDTHAGQLIGSVAGAWMFGGPMVAAGVVAMEAIGTAFQTQRESIVAARKAAADYTATLGELVSTWSGFATSLIKQSSFGSNMGKEYDLAEAAANKHFAALSKLVVDRQPFTDALWQELKSPIDPEWADEGSSFTRAKRSETAQYKIESDVASHAAEFRKQEMADHLSGLQEILTTEKKVYAAEAMHAGPAKDSALLDAKIAASTTQRMEVQRAERAQAQAGVKEAWVRFNALDAAKDRPATDTEHTAAVLLAEQAKTRMYAAMDARKALKEQQEKENEAAADKDDADRESQANQVKDRLRKEAYAADQAGVNATELGYAKEVDLLKLKHKEEQAEYVAENRDQVAMDQLAKRQKDELAALDLSRDYQIGESRKRLEERYAVATGKMTAIDAQWADQARQLKLEGLSPEKIKDREDLFRKIEPGELAKSIALEAKKNSFARDAIEHPALERASRIRTMLAEAKASGSSLTPEQAAARVDSEMSLERSKFVMQQTAALHPERQYDAIKAKYDAAVKQGSMSATDEKYLLKKEARELLGGTMGGEFTNATSLWESVQSKIIQKDDLPKKTLEEITHVKDALLDLLRGVKLAA